MEMVSRPAWYNAYVTPSIRGITDLLYLPEPASHALLFEGVAILKCLRHHPCSAKRSRLLCLRLDHAVPQVSSDAPCLRLGHAVPQVKLAAPCLRRGHALPQVSSATPCLRLGHTVPQVSSAMLCLRLGHAVPQVSSATRCLRLSHAMPQVSLATPCPSRYNEYVMQPFVA